MGLRLVGEPPTTQHIVSRWIREGDYILRSGERSFAIVTHVMHASEAGTVTIEFDDGDLWMGGEDEPFVVPAHAEEACEWNRRERELKMRSARKARAGPG